MFFFLNIDQLPEQMCDSQHTKTKEIHSKKQVNVFLAEKLKWQWRKIKLEYPSLQYKNYWIKISIFPATIRHLRDSKTKRKYRHIDTTKI